MKEAKNQKKVGIILINWNDYKNTSACLESLDVVSYRPLDIYVVDNNSADDSLEMLKKRFPDVIFVESEENSGFAKNNNIGAQKAIEDGCEYLFFLNNDTLVSDALLLAKLLTPFSLHNAPGLVAPLVRSRDGSLQHTWWSFIFFWRQLSILLGLNRFLPNEENPPDSGFKDVLSFIAAVVPASLYDSLGGLDAQFFFGGEESDFCYRLSKIGKRAFLESSSDIVHLGGESGMWDKPTRRFIGSLLFLRKHRGFIPALVMKYLIAVVLGLRCGSHFFKGLIFPSRREEFFSNSSRFGFASLFFFTKSLNKIVSTR